MSDSLLFVGRVEEIARCQRLHAQRRHVLLVGEEGIGKTALIEHLLVLGLPLLVCWQSGSFQAISNSLNRNPAIHAGQRILPRQHELLSVLTKAKKPVVFDRLGWTNLKLSSFFECVAKRTPVWISCRSAELWDFGFYKPFLWKFARVDLKPFCLDETCQMVKAALSASSLQLPAPDEIERLHSVYHGNPGALCKLLESFPRKRAPRTADARKAP